MKEVFLGGGGGGVEGERRWFDTVIVWAVPSTERVELALGRYDGR